MLKEFYNKESLLCGLVAFLIACSGLFLNVAVKPELVDMLNNINLFFLISFNITVTLLCWRLVVFLFKKERGSTYLGKISFGAFSLLVAYFLLWMLLQSWLLAVSLYPKSSGKFLEFVLPISTLFIICWFGIFLEKNEQKFSSFTKVISSSFLFTVMVLFVLSCFSLAFFKIIPFVLFNTGALFIFGVFVIMFGFIKTRKKEA